MFYFITEQVSAWVSLESTKIKISPKLYLYSADMKRLIKHTNNPFLKNTIEVCFDSHNYLGGTSHLSWFSPVVWQMQALDFGLITV